jgi:Spy/CpxP family protein refolding chaperone
LALAVSSLAIGNALAEPEKKCAADNQAKNAARMDMLRDISQLDLTADQKAKIAELKKEYGPKLKEIWQARQDVLTPEQKQARADVLSAAKAARAVGKKPGNVRKAVAAAVNLSAEQKAKLAKLSKAAATLRADARAKALSILTPEQLAQLKELKKARHKAHQAGGSQPAPAENAPTEKAPTDKAPAEKAPAGQTPAQQAPAGQ